MTVGDYASVPLDLSHLPEFQISPRSAWAEPMAGARRYGPHLGELPAEPITFTAQMRSAPKGTRRTLSEADQAHHDGKPYAKRFPHPVNLDRKPPVGTTKPLEGLGHFLDRIEEIAAIAATQNLELPTAQQELGAISLSSSFSDDDDDDSFEVDSELVERHATRYGTAYTVPEQGLLDRIEWEDFVLRCSTTVKIFVKVKDDGSTTVSSNDARVKGEMLAPFVPKLRALLGDRSIDDLVADRDRASYYKRLVWSLLTPKQQAAWTRRSPAVQAYLNPEQGSPRLDDWQPDYLGHDLLGSVLVEDPDEDEALVTAAPPAPAPVSGPQELGLHETYYRDDRGGRTPGTVESYEPSEAALTAWPKKYHRIYRWTHAE